MTVDAVLQHTLDLCADALPADTHPIVRARLAVIRRIVKWTMQQDEYEDYWAGVLRREEHRVDVDLQRTRS